MKTKNIRKKQARRYARYINKLKFNVSKDTWIFDPPTVVYRLFPGIFIGERHDYFSYASFIKHCMDSEAIIQEAIALERAKEEARIYAKMGPLVPPTNKVASVLDPDKIEELFG